MLTQDWDAWVIRHCTAFAIGDHQMAMFAEWQSAFLVASYTIEELNEATTWLITHPPENLWHHLRAIQSRIFDRRKAQAVHNDRATERPGAEPHETCGGTGWVFVPHLKHVKDGQWFPPWATFCVTCHCARGERIAGTHGDDKPKAMSLFMYEGRNPNWREQIRTRHLQQLAMNRAETATEYATKGRKSLVQGIGTDARMTPSDKRTADQVIMDEAKKRREP